MVLSEIEGGDYLFRLLGRFGSNRLEIQWMILSRLGWISTRVSFFVVWNSLLGFDYAGSEVDLFGKVVPFRWPGVFWSTSSYAIRFFFCDL